jgi:hypothetical protein
MSTPLPDAPLPEHLEALLAEGSVYPGDGSRFLPEPVKLAEGDRTATDYVAESRR